MPVMPAVQRVYRFRMRPTRGQEQSLSRLAGARRWAWNWALARRNAYFAERGKSIPPAQLSAELTALKSQPDTAWLKGIDSQLLQQSLRDLEAAFREFFAGRARFPRFKTKKRDAERFRIPQRVKVANGNVYVPKIGYVRIRQSQTIDGQTKSATFKRDACGHWYVTLVAAFTMPDVPLPEPDPDNVVGIDVGLKDFAVISTGEKVEAPRFYRKAERKLRQLQRVLSRRKPGSNRRRKAKQRIACFHRKIANRRQDFIHKFTTGIIRRFDGVCVESLNVRGMVRTKLAKSIGDAALGECLRQLAYKAVWNRKHHVAVDRFFPSSKMCGACGAINTALTLSDRSWSCACGAVHDRDLNAARNIRDEGLRMLAAGHAESRNAQGVRVSPATVGSGR